MNKTYEIPRTISSQQKSSSFSYCILHFSPPPPAGAMQVFNLNSVRRNVESQSTRSNIFVDWLLCSGSQKFNMLPKQKFKSFSRQQALAPLPIPRSFRFKARVFFWNIKGKSSQLEQNCCHFCTCFVCFLFILFYFFCLFYFIFLLVWSL